jgi:hypothetical protein
VVVNSVQSVQKVDVASVLLVCACAVSANTWAAPVCNVPEEKWMKESDLRRELRRKGYLIGTIRIVQGCYELYGLDPRGRRIQILIDPETAKPAVVQRSSDIESQ